MEEKNFLTSGTGLNDLKLFQHNYDTISVFSYYFG
jgi:hypothetical protein